MATGNKKIIKFKDAPKKTRKKRKVEAKPVKDARKASQVKSELKKDKETSSKQPPNQPIQGTTEEQVKLFGMGMSSGGITFSTRVKTSWDKLKNKFNKKPKKEEKKQRAIKITKVEKSEPKSKKEQQGITSVAIKKNPSLKLLPSGTLLMLPAPGSKQDKANLFPKIYRIITETRFQAAVLSLILLISIGLMLRELHQHMQQKNALEQKRAGIQKEIVYWQGVVRKYQNYRDGYFKLAVLEYQLGNTQAAQKYVERTKTLDPNFSEADKLEKMLSSST